MYKYDTLVKLAHQMFLIVDGAKNGGGVLKRVLTFESNGLQFQERTDSGRFVELDSILCIRRHLLGKTAKQLFHKTDFIDY